VIRLKEEYEPNELIGSIKELRYAHDDTLLSLERYLKYSAALVKSPIALLLSKKNEKEWELTSSYGFTEAQNEKEQAIHLALEMSERVIKRGFTYNRCSVEWIEFNNQIAFAVQVDTGNKGEQSFVYFILEYKSQQHLSEMVIRTMMNSDIPTFFDNQEKPVYKEKALDKGQQALSTDVLEILSKIIFQEKFLLASMFLVNEISTRFNCSRVSIGWEKGNYVNPIAISHVEKFDKNMESIRSMEALYEESADQNQEIHYPLKELDDTIIFAHHSYLEKEQLNELVSIPFRHNERVIGVLSCEKLEGEFSEEELLLLRLLSNYITPWLQELYEKDRWIGSRFLLKSKHFLSRFFSLKHTLLKFSIVIFSLFLLYATFGTWQYRVEVVSSLETNNIARITAPFDGLVYEVNVYAGDQVEKGDKLLTFDQDELYLNESEALADINKYTSESEKARASSSLADMRIALSKKREAELNLERVKYYLKKSELFAPLDGVIIAGDKEELLGQPISKGELLFKVAQSTDLYLKLKIPEKSIDEMNPSLEGEFALLSTPDRRYRFRIDNIIPMAEVDSTEGNIFIAHATVLGASQDWWRPGMSGVAKIEVGERNIMWILTHDFVEFIRMYFWI
jgi:hypothetical protein